MRDFLIKWFVNIITLVVVVHTIAGVSVDSWQTTIVAALVLGLLNTFLRPLLLLLTLPFNMLSLGFLTLVINGLMFFLAARFVTGFAVKDFWSAFWAALLFSIISFLLNMLLRPGVNFRVYSHNMSARHNHNGPRARYNDAIDVEGEEEKKDDGQ